MITYNNIVTKFQEFVDNHFLLQTFSHGSPSDVDLDKFEVYPLLHLVYIGGNYGENTKTYNLECYILDLPPSATDKVDHQQAAMSNSEQVAEDILADVKNGGNIFAFGYYYDVTSANITPLEETQSNVLAGTLLSLTIEVAFGYDSCNAPITGVDPEGDVTPSFKSRGLLRVKTEDNVTDVLSVATINVSNGSLSDDGNGVVTLQTGSSSSGQTTIWKANTDESNVVNFAPGITPVSLGTIANGKLTIDSSTDLRAGFAIGTNIGGTGLVALPVSSGSQVVVEIKYEITLDTGGVAVLASSSIGGLFPASLPFTTYTTAGTHVETVTSTTNNVSVFQTSNTLGFNVTATVSGSVRVYYTKITIIHA